jgi:hypothetical protein
MVDTTSKWEDELGRWLNGRGVWRDGEINIGDRHKGRVRQAREENRNANGDYRGTAAQANGCKISDYDCAPGDRKKNEAAEFRILKQGTCDHVPESRKIIPLLVSEGKRPWILEGNLVLLSDQVSAARCHPKS